MSGMGFAGLLGIKLTPPSGAATIIIMTLAVADSVHILITMIQAMRRGESKEYAIKESLKVNFLPVFITSLTTVIGFLSMNTAEVPPFRDLGNITAMGMTVAFVLSVTLLPVLVSIFPMKVKVKPQNEDKQNESGFFNGLANLVTTRKTPILIGSVFFISVFTYLTIIVNQIHF